MNAPPQLQRKAYEPAVLALLPGCEGEELQLRCSLMLMRDRAMSNKRGACDEAYGVLEHVERLASLNALKSMPLADLAEVCRLLVMLTTCASGLEACFSQERVK